jgi:hypothetical protein
MYGKKQSDLKCTFLLISFLSQKIWRLKLLTNYVDQNFKATFGHFFSIGNTIYCLKLINIWKRVIKLSLLIESHISHPPILVQHFMCIAKIKVLNCEKLFSIYKHFFNFQYSNFVCDLSLHF